MGDLLHETARSLRAQALRFLLTSMGIVWGTAMLITLTAYTDGYDVHFQREIARVGPNVVWALPGVRVEGRAGERGGRPIELELDDAQHVAAVESVELVSAELHLGLRVHRHGRRTKLLWTFGVTEDMARIRNIEVARGRFIAAHDVQEAARVLFLGHAAAQRLFGSEAAVGKLVHIDSIPFRVIGVASHEGEQIVNVGPKDDELALIPATAAQRSFTYSDNAGVMILTPRSPEQGPAAIRSVRSILGLRHDFRPADDLALDFFDIRKAVDVIQQVGLGLHLFLTITGLITLLVGVIGVTNIMLVVVSERTEEIGLRKAVGASSRAIFVQFLAETLAVTVLGGIAGSALGWMLVRGAQAATPPDQTFAPMPLLEGSSVIALGLLLVSAGVAAGVLPARRAARIEPAVTLRSA